MKQKKLQGIFPLLLVIFCLLFCTVPALAEEEENQEEETEFIPEGRKRPNLFLRSIMILLTPMRYPDGPREKRFMQRQPM